MFKVKEIVEVCKGELLLGNVNQIIETFTRDSREITSKSEMFLSFIGENFNGNDFFEEALKNGAIGCIVNKDIDKEIVEKYENKIIIKVDNTVEAIQRLAKYKREQYNIPVIAVTGSVGKTSTKDLIASVVAKKYNVLKTRENNNNDIGLALTLLRLEDHNAIVLEIGMNHFGEISRLAKIAQPTIAVINNIGTAHIGNLGSREGILKAKLEILEGLKENGILVINNDNDLLSKWNRERKMHKTNRSDDSPSLAPHSSATGKEELLNFMPFSVQTFGIENKSDFMAYDIEYNENSSKYNINIENSTYNIEVPVGGEHFVLNSLGAICVGKLLNINKEDILEGIKNFELSKMRMDIKKTSKDILIINDAYNASYDSMKYTLRYLNSLDNTRKIAVLGDMLELGEYAKELHEKVGEEVAKNNIDILITLGENSKYIANRAKELKINKEIYECNTIDEISSILKAILKKGDAILIKGSRGMELEKVLEGIRDVI